MKELAFIVNKDSEFYNNYFKAKEEKQHFHNLARVFFEHYDLVDSAEYYQTKFLGLKLNAEQKKKFATQLRKNDDSNGMSIFKKNSAMQRSWNEEVVSKVNFEIINAVQFWYMGFLYHGSHSLWDYNGVVYGYLKDNLMDEISLPDCMTEIKMSEYYSVIESLEA